MYVLLFTDECQNPRYIQGSIEEINAEFRVLWNEGVIDRSEWDGKEPWQLLGIEDGRLTPMSNVDADRVPQFEVY
jgi:hypothetical protein